MRLCDGVVQGNSNDVLEGGWVGDAIRAHARRCLDADLCGDGTVIFGNMPGEII